MHNCSHKMRSWFFVICFIVLPGLVSAQESISDLKAMLNRASADSQKISVYKKIISYFSLEKPDSAEHYGQQAINYAISKNYALGEGIILEHLGIIDRKQGRIELARKRFQSALEVFKVHNDAYGEARMINGLGAIEAGKGNYDVALKYFLESLKMRENQSDHEGLMLNYLNIANIYMQQDDSGSADKYLELAAKVSKSIPLSDVSISVYNTMGVYAIAKGDSQKGLQIFTNNLKLSDKPGFANSHVECLSYLGEYYLDGGRPETALQYLRAGLNIATEKKLAELEGNLLMQIGQIIKEKHPDSGLAYLMKAKALSEQIHNRRFLIYVYEEIANYYKERNQFKEALAATEDARKMVDSVFSLDKAREIASIGYEYEFEKSRERMSQLEQQNARAQQEKKVIAVVSIAIVIILLVLLFYFRKARLLNKELIKKRQELNDLNELKNKLFSIIGHDLRGHIARIPAIMDIYKDDDSTEEDKAFLLESLKEHSKSSLETLDKLLFWGRSLVKGDKINMVNFHPKGYIAEAIEFKRMAAEEKEITVIDRTQSHLSVFADATHFDFIVRNLLANAIKYTRQHGKIEIAADSVMRPEYIVFSVKDNGVGIPDDIRSKIFTPMRSMPGTANEAGNGIGLMLCKEFAQLNGGDIWLESQEGVGSTFYFSVKKAV